MKQVKRVISMIVVTLLLFLFSCVLLKENSLYSLASAIVPFPLYSLMDKINVLRKMKNTSQKRKIVHYSRNKPFNNACNGELLRIYFFKRGCDLYICGGRPIRDYRLSIMVCYQI